MVLKLAEGVSPRLPPPQQAQPLGALQWPCFWRNAQLPGGLASFHPGVKCRVLGFHSATTGRKFLWSGLICKSLFSCLTAIFLLTLKRILVSSGDSWNEEMGLHLGAVLQTEILLFIAVEWEPVRAVGLAWEAVGTAGPGWGAGWTAPGSSPAPGTHSPRKRARSVSLSVSLCFCLSPSLLPAPPAPHLCGWTCVSSEHCFWLFYLRMGSVSAPQAVLHEDPFS